MKIQFALIALAASIAVTGCQPATTTTEADGTSSGGTAEAPAPERYEKAILETAELMKLMVDPTYELLKDAIEVAPEGRKAWRNLYIQAFNLAELNNLNFSRVDEEYMLTPEWIEESKKGIEVTVRLAESIKGQADYEVLKENYLAVMNNCNECHRHFDPGEIDAIEGPRSWGLEVDEDPAKISFQ